MEKFITFLKLILNFGRHFFSFLGWLWNQEYELNDTEYTYSTYEKVSYFLFDDPKWVENKHYRNVTRHYHWGRPIVVALICAFIMLIVFLAVALEPVFYFGLAVPFAFQAIKRWKNASPYDGLGREMYIAEMIALLCLPMMFSATFMWFQMIGGAVGLVHSIDMVNNYQAYVQLELWTQQIIPGILTLVVLPAMVSASIRRLNDRGVKNAQVKVSMGVLVLAVEAILYVMTMIFTTAATRAEDVSVYNGWMTISGIVSDAVKVVMGITMLLGLFYLLTNPKKSVSRPKEVLDWSVKDAISSLLKKAFDVTGTTKRSRFVYVYGITVIVIGLIFDASQWVAKGILFTKLNGQYDYQIWFEAVILLVTSVIFIIPMLTMFTRRLNNVGFTTPVSLALTFIPAIIQGGIIWYAMYATSYTSLNTVINLFSIILYVATIAMMFLPSRLVKSRGPEVVDTENIGK